MKDYMTTLLDVFCFPVFKVVSKAGNQRRFFFLFFFSFEVSFANLGQFIALTRDARQATEGTLNLSYLYAFIHTNQQSRFVKV